MASAVKGLRELDAKLAALGVAAGEKVMRQALRAAMRPVLEAAKTAAPEGTELHRTYRGRLVAPGFGKRSVRLVIAKPGRDGKFRAALGVRREAFYMLQFVELGTSKMAAQPWLTPAFEAEVPATTERMAAELKKRIERAAKARGGA